MVASVLLFVVLQLWRADLSVPFEYVGDAVWGLAIVKGMIEHGWIWVNQSLGAPGAMNLLDYPATDLLSYLAIRVIAYLTGDAALTINVFYLLGYPLCALSALWGFRRLGLSRSLSAAFALLYAFLPYHFMRGAAHLFLSAYYLVPFGIVFALELMGQRTPLVTGGRIDLRSRAALLPLAAMAIIGMTGVYYAYFTCFFLLVAGFWGWWRKREIVRLKAAFVLIGVVVLAALLALSPYVFHRVTAGPNPEAASRSYADPEVYPLRITQLLLPVRHHRVGPLASIREQYQSGLATIWGPNMDNESDFAALGIIGALGFMLLLLTAIFGIRKREPQDHSDDAATALGPAAALTVAALVLATASGLCTFVGFLLPQIRAYNRISVFVAFLAFLAAGSLLQRFTSTWRTPALCWALAVAIVGIGILDQTTPAMVPRYEQVAAEWSADSAFVEQVETSIAEESRVFQLPYVPFPESAPVVGMVDYDHFKPYLHSTKARWSYGAVKGRETAAWQRGVSALDADRMIAELKQAGFAGVWVNREGYADGGSAIIAELEGATGTTSTSSPAGSFAYIPLGPRTTSRP